jgi:hypothetical protein
MPLIYILTSTYSLTHSLTPSNTDLLERIAGSQLAKNFSTFYRNRTFSSALTIARHLSLPWVISIQNMHLYLTSWKIHFKNILLFELGALKWNFSFCFPHKKPVYNSSVNQHATRPHSHAISFLQGKKFSKSSLISTNSFITILIDGYNERLLLFLRQLLLTACVCSQLMPAANAHNNGSI